MPKKIVKLKEPRAKINGFLRVRSSCFLKKLDMRMRRVYNIIKHFVRKRRT